MEQIHLYIQKLREQNRYSQQDMADKLGLSQTAYRHIETGDTKLTIERLFELAEVFKVSPEEILYCGKAGGKRISVPPVQDTENNTESLIKSIVVPQLDIEELAKLIERMAKDVQDIKQALEAKPKKP